MLENQAAEAMWAYYKANKAQIHTDASPDGHPKLPHLWPPKLLHPDWSNRLLLDGLVWPFSYGNFSLDFYKKAEWPSAARQAEGSKPGSGGQLSHRCVAPTVHGLARWSGQLFTAGACPTNLPN